MTKIIILINGQCPFELRSFAEKGGEAIWRTDQDKVETKLLSL